ncbi:hypothetical protein MKL26_07040, partial [Streptococcus suis]|nr:hypothetical protein [Streptococcus suis]
VEKIDIKKYELYWKEHIKSKLGSKVLGYHGLGVTSFYQGKFDESLYYFDKSRQEKMQTKKLRLTLEESRKNFIIQAKIFLVQCQKGNSFFKETELAELLKEADVYMKAIMDVMYYKQPNTFFEQSFAPSSQKLDRLMYKFYQAENALLLNDVYQAKILFEELSQENRELYIVKEANKKLATL